MFVHYRTSGIILNEEERGESDLLFTIYTKDFGKLEILGKAIRKINSKLRPAAGIFYLSDIEFIQGRINKTLVDAVSLEKFSEIQRDFRKIRIAYKIYEALENFIKGQEPDEKIWQLLTRAFKTLNDWRAENSLGFVYYYFFWNFIFLLGYAPELYLCAVCQSKLIPEKLYFSAKEGGFICQNCSKRAQLNQGIGQETVKILRIITKINWRTLSRIKIKENHLKELREISEEYHIFLCGKSSSF